MRIVRHPNIVELKAFYYSNGDRVMCDEFPLRTSPTDSVLVTHRKTKFTLTWYSSTSRKPCIAHLAISTS
jgi:hypothetical protein